MSPFTGAQARVKPSFVVRELGPEGEVHEGPPGVQADVRANGGEVLQVQRRAHLGQEIGQARRGRCAKNDGPANAQEHPRTNPAMAPGLELHTVSIAVRRQQQLPDPMGAAADRLRVLAAGEAQQRTRPQTPTAVHHQVLVQRPAGAVCKALPHSPLFTWEAQGVKSPSVQLQHNTNFNLCTPRSQLTGAGSLRQGSNPDLSKFHRRTPQTHKEGSRKSQKARGESHPPRRRLHNQIIWGHSSFSARAPAWHPFKSLQQSPAKRAFMGGIRAQKRKRREAWRLPGQLPGQHTHHRHHLLYAPRAQVARS